MASNQFGQIFRITTWGESHGKAIGVVIDGCPAGLFLSEEEINHELSHRAPGKSPYTSPRKEADRAEILSGVFEGKTTGAPISIMIPNQDADPSRYEPIKDKLRPSHANFTYLEKYGCFDWRGGGRSSARETASRVAAGAVAKKLLMEFGIEVTAFIQSIGNVSANIPEHEEIDTLHEATVASPIFCPDLQASKEMIEALSEAIQDGDSLGGIVEFRIEGVPAGLGDPIYEKIDSNLAKAMLSINACKGFELGSGFSSCRMKGSEHNDIYDKNIEGKIITRTNHSGGVLAGITTGMPIRGRCVFKPTSSINKSQETLNEKGEKTELNLPEGSKMDPCVAIRGACVVEAMAALVMADSLLMHRSAKLFQVQSPSAFSL